MILRNSPKSGPMRLRTDSGPLGPEELGEARRWSVLQRITAPGMLALACDELRAA